MKKMLELGCVVAFGMAMALLTAGCGILNGDTGDSIKSAIIEYIETNGKEKAESYLDKLVADGRLGSANAADIKAALPDGIEKVKDVINKIGETK